MAPDDPTISQEDFDAALDLSQLDDRRAHDETLEPTMAPRFRRERRREKLEEARARLAAIDGTGNTVRIKSQIAEGGMGRIMLAEQGGLRREVAAKTLRDEFLDGDFADRLIREARITGLVEHPNIVPVYALQTDERGAPLMIMRKIEGVSWRTIIRDDSHEMVAGARGQLLEWHLRVLMSVCDAISYAHSRGILHLDVKPDNVMVGSFRDVYVVDWGVACSMRNEHRGVLPHVDEVTEILGTPAYLAPEVVDPKQAKLSPQTDVFLLGATLFEVLTKHPPHRGESVRDLLYEAYLAKPPVLPPEVPVELAAIVRRAMHHRPSDRFESADAFRFAIEEYLRHRGSSKLSAESAASLEQLRATLARGGQLEAAETGSVLRGFAECRFGFAQALRDWPENVDAQEGIVDATLLFAEFHLARREPAAAASLLGEIREPAGRFAERIEIARQSVASARADIASLHELREQTDDSRSRVARAYWVLGLVGILVVPMFGGFAAERTGLYHWQWWHSIAYAIFFVVVISTGAILMRRTLMPNRVSRRLVVAFLFLAVAMVVRRLLAYQMGHVAFEEMGMDMFLFGIGCGVVGTLTDTRFFAAALACVLAGVSTALNPEYAMLFVGLAGLLGPSAMALLWIVGERRRDARRRAGAQSSGVSSRSRK